MRRMLVVSVVCCAAGAWGLPTGLSGISVGFGGSAVPGGFMQGEFDFALSNYICLGPELVIGFDHDGSIGAGGAGRFYFIPNNAGVAQPNLSFGAGIMHQFDDTNPEDPHDVNHEQTGVYIDFGVACDFEIPNSPVSPYADLGAAFLMADDSDAGLKFELGIRINTW